MSIYDRIAQGFNPGAGALQAEQIKQQQQQNALARQMQERKMGLQEKQYGLQEQKLGMEQQQQKLENMLKGVAWAQNPEQWGQLVSHYEAQGVQIPPQFKMVTPENFEDIKKQAFIALLPETEQYKALYPEAQAAKPTSLMQNLQAAGLKPGTPEYQQAIMAATTKPLVSMPSEKRILSAEEKQSLGLDVNAPFVWSKSGEPKPVKPTGYTDTQLAAAGYAERMDTAEPLLDSAVAEGAQPESLAYAFGVSTPLGNYVMSESDQKYRQAAEDWVRAKLRKESGAVIGDEEMAREIKTYFPMPGDKQTVIEQKRRRRQIATRALARQSGGSYRMGADDAEQQPQQAPVNPSEIDALVNMYAKPRR